MEQYAKPLPDGTYEIAGPIVYYCGKKLYYPSKKTLLALGYLRIIDTIPNKQIPGYKLVDKGITREGDHFVHHLKQLKIVDNGPNPGPGMELRTDYWKETDTEYIHVYKYRSKTRHVTPTLLPETQKKLTPLGSSRKRRSKSKKSKGDEANES